MKLKAPRIFAAGGATIAAGAAMLALTAVPASAAVTGQAASQNWAGYVAQNNNFSAVSGSWVQPSATCTSGSGPTYAAFWVGLGGSGSGQSNALEQTGTQADCTASGKTTYYAWYELVPAAPVKLNLAVKPGDHITAKVKVDGTNVTMTLWNTTTGQSVTKTLQTNDIDTSSAEWIAEAPSACDSTGNCQPLSLADFGTAHFTGASATAGGHTGTISDSNWDAQQVDLSGGSSSQHFGPTSAAYEQSSGSSSGSAQTSSLSSSGSAFSVAWQAADSSVGSQGGATATSTGSGSADPYGQGDPYGDGSGYGYGSGGYGYGSGSGGYGYGGGYGSGSGGYGYGGGYGGYGDGAAGYGIPYSYNLGS